MTLVPAGELALHGLTLQSDITALWDTWAVNQTPANKAIAATCGAYMKDEMGIASIASLQPYYYREIVEAVESQGGKAAWVRTLEHLSTISLSRVPTGAPPSADLVNIAGDSTPLLQQDARRPARFPSEPPGKYLARTAQLTTFKLPLNRLRRWVRFGKDPKKHPLAELEQRHIVMDLWLWNIEQGLGVGSCATHRELMAAQLSHKDAFPHLAKSRQWDARLKWLWQNLRKNSAKVCSELPFSRHTMLLTCMCACSQDVYTSLHSSGLHNTTPVTLDPKVQEMKDKGLWIPPTLLCDPTSTLKLFEPEEEEAEVFENEKENAPQQENVSKGAPSVPPSVAARKPSQEAKRQALSTNRAALAVANEQIVENGGDEEPAPPSSGENVMPAMKKPAGETLKAVKARRREEQEAVRAKKARVLQPREGTVLERGKEEDGTTSKLTYLRKKASEQADENLTTAYVNEGEKVTITDEETAAGVLYYRLKLRSRRVGWIKHKYIGNVHDAVSADAPVADKKSDKKSDKESGKKRKKQKINAEGDPIFPEPTLTDDPETSSEASDEEDSDEDGDEVEDGNVWDVLEIHNHRLNESGEVMYHVEWEPNTDGKTYPWTWEPMDHVQECDALKAFLAANPSQPTE